MKKLQNLVKEMSNRGWVEQQDSYMADLMKLGPFQDLCHMVNSVLSGKGYWNLYKKKWNLERVSEEHKVKIHEVLVKNLRRFEQEEKE
jgi:hypothetical protein